MGTQNFIEFVLVQDLLLSGSPWLLQLVSHYSSPFYINNKWITSLQTFHDFLSVFFFFFAYVLLFQGNVLFHSLALSHN